MILTRNLYRINRSGFVLGSAGAGHCVFMGLLAALWRSGLPKHVCWFAGYLVSAGGQVAIMGYVWRRFGVVAAFRLWWRSGGALTGR
jgi:hypothetical protein